MKNKITVSFLRDLDHQLLNDEISYSRYAELINERIEDKDSFLLGLISGTILGFIIGVVTMVLCQMLNTAL